MFLFCHFFHFLGVIFYLFFFNFLIVFPRKILFLAEIFIFGETFDFWRKFLFLAKLLILTKIFIFRQIFFIFGEYFDFRRKFRLPYQYFSFENFLFFLSYYFWENKITFLKNKISRIFFEKFWRSNFAPYISPKFYKVLYDSGQNYNFIIISNFKHFWNFGSKLK